jgi:hypothetical protein
MNNNFVNNLAWRQRGFGNQRQNFSYQNRFVRRNNNIGFRRRRGFMPFPRNVLRRSLNINNRPFIPNLGIRRFNNMGISNRNNFNSNNRSNFRRTAPMSNISMNRRLTAPNSIGFTHENFQRTSQVITRSGIINSLIVPTPGQGNAPSSFRAYASTLHPRNLPWINLLSQMYDKYMFKNFYVRYVPNVGTQVTGSAFVAFDYERHHNLPEELAVMQCMDKFTLSPVWSSSSWVSVPLNILADKWYDCTLEGDRDSFHDYSPARVVYGYDGIDTVATTRYLGRIEVKFTIVLSRPTANTSLNTLLPPIVEVNDCVTKLSNELGNLSIDTSSILSLE